MIVTIMKGIDMGWVGMQRGLHIYVSGGRWRIHHAWDVRHGSSSIKAGARAFQWSRFVNKIVLVRLLVVFVIIVFLMGQTLVPHKKITFKISREASGVGPPHHTCV